MSDTISSSRPCPVRGAVPAGLAFLLAFSWVLSSTQAVKPRPAEGRFYCETAHYRVFSDRADAPATASLLESLHERLDRFFSEAPEESTAANPPPVGKVEVQLFADAASYVEKIREDGVFSQHLEDSGGFCPIDRRTIYVHRRADDDYRRYLVLHEAVHRYVLDRFGENFSDPENWLIEGFADAFAVHRRISPGSIAWGTPPSISQTDFPGRFLAMADRGELPLSPSELLEMDRVFSDGSLGDLNRHAIAWAVVRKLIEDHPRSFWRLWEGLRSGASIGDAWQTLSMKEKPTGKALRDWVWPRRTPWRVIWSTWEERSCRDEHPPEAGSFRGFSETSALAVLQSHVTMVELELSPSESGRPFSGGVVFGRSEEMPKRFDLLLIDSAEGDCRWFRREEETWKYRRRWELAPSKEPWRYRVEPTDEATEIFLGEMRLLRLPPESQRVFGVFIERSSVRFSWKLLAKREEDDAVPRTPTENAGE